MILCSALYYPASLTEPHKLVRDNRLYVGKAAETFPVWWSYVRKHYPDVHIHLFADAGSPVSLRPLLRHVSEAWEEVRLDSQRLIHDPFTGFDETEPKVTVEWVSQHSGKYFWPMQRNLVQGIITSYRANEDLFWLDNDCFLNTDIRPLVRGLDFAAPSIAAHQMTADSVCTYISARRLHALDDLGVDLPAFLTTLLNDGPTDTRMHTFQEGGLYKLFCYGEYRAIGRDLNLSHLSNLPHFFRFIEHNPLESEAYQHLRWLLANLDLAKLEGVDLDFLDMYWEAQP